MALGRLVTNSRKRRVGAGDHADGGAVVTEYAILIFLIALFLIAALLLFRAGVGSMYVLPALS